MKRFMGEFFHAIWEVFKLPFVLIGVGFRRLFHLGWRNLAMLVTAAVILTFVVLTLFFEVTSQPEFCGTCHIMQPYVVAWKTSSHSDIDCITCHARPGIKGYFETKFTALSMLANYVTGLYRRSKPWAEIEDANCLSSGCHETRLLEGRIEMASGVMFDHTPHLTQTRRGRKLRCTSCHSQIVQGEHISITPTTCFLCHFKNVEAEGREELAECTRCHTPPTGERAAARNTYDHAYILKENVPCISCHQPMWQGEGTVRKERCGACHGEVEKIEKIGDLEFIHEWHVEKRKVDCMACHDPIEHRMPRTSVMLAKECASCHQDPHAPALAVYRGEGSRLVENAQPNSMFSAGVSCVSCHKNPVTGYRAARVGKNACTPCHSEKYVRLAESWRRSYQAQIRALEDALRRSGPSPKIEDARHDLALLKRGGPWHNPEFAESVIEAVSGVLSGGRALPAVSFPEKSRPCLVCHSGIEAVPPPLEYSSFDHAAHLSERGIACGQCHIGGKPEDALHGRRKPAGELCASCHHDGKLANEENSCEPCHQPSRLTYFGKLPGMAEQPSPMAESEMACADCHEADAGYAPPGAEFCLDCHEQEVLDGLEFTREELIGAIVAAKGRAGEAAEVVQRDPGRAVHNPDLAKEVLGIAAGSGGR